MERHVFALSSTLLARRLSTPFGALAGALFAAALLSVSQPARALEEYGAQIPNLTSAGGCDGLCHATGFGDSPFYQAFAAAGFVWNPTMANADSDLDGFSNGWELQNPAGNWVSGTAYPGSPALVSDPVAAGSTPPLPVAVTPFPITHSEAAGDDGFEDFMVENVGAVPFDYTVAADETWMAPDPAGGMALPAGMADALVLLFTTGALTEGGYMGNLTVTIPGIRADRIPSVPVSLTVPEPGQIAAQTAALVMLGVLARRRRSRA
jgi:hypothetical protein